MLSLIAWQTTFSYRRSAYARNRLHAEYYAQNALGAAIAKIRANAAWGSAGSESIHIGPLAGDDANCFADLTFNNSSSLPFSSYNIQGQTPLTGWNGSNCPAGTALLVAQGSYKGVARRWEAVVSQPAFPFAMASSGPINATGSFVVASVANASQASGGVSTIAPGDLQPGNLVSDSSATPAIVLQGPSIRITGDIITPGTCTPGPTVYVGGRVRQKDDPVQIPKIDITSYDTSLQPLHQELKDSTYPYAQFLQGFWHHSGKLTITSGGIKFSAGVLYVDGDLDVTGPVTGLGALFCTGSITINGDATLDPTDTLALLAKGGITITGSNQNSSYLNGIVYSEGPLSLQSVTVLGALLCNSKDPSQPLSLQNVNVLRTDSSVQAAFTYPLDEGPPNTGAGFSAGAELAPGLNVSSFFVPSMNGGKGGFDPSQINASTVPFFYGGKPYDNLAQAVADATIKHTSPPPDSGYSSWASLFSGEQTRKIAGMQAVLTQLNAQYLANLSPALAHGQFSLDLNQFISPDQRFRLLLYREAL